MPLTESEKLTWLWEHARIEQTMLRFGRALDLGDWPSYRSCLTDRIRVDFERLTGFPEIEVDADAWVRFAELALSPVMRHHQYTNFSADISSDHAVATTYMVARHRRLTDRGSPDNTQYGWYETGWLKLGGEWKMSRLSHQFVWIAGNDALFDFTAPELAAQMSIVFCAENLVSR